MKYQVLFSLKKNEKVFMNASAAVVIGALRVIRLLNTCHAFWFFLVNCSCGSCVVWNFYCFESS